MNWDTSTAVAGQSFTNANLTYSSSQGYGQMVIGTSAISGKRYWTLSFTNGTASDDVVIGVAQTPINANTDVGGATSGSGYGASYGYSTKHGFIQGAFDYTQITSWPYYATSTSANVIGVGYDASTRLLEIYKDGVLISDALTDSTPETIPQLAAGTYYPAVSVYGGQSITIDPNPTSVPAGYVALDAPSSGFLIRTLLGL